MVPFDATGLYLSNVGCIIYVDYLWKLWNIGKTTRTFDEAITNSQPNAIT